jgi:hypothetical protein
MLVHSIDEVDRGPVTWEQYIRDSAVPRGMIDDFLQRPNWTQFDSEVGYILHNSLVQWGLEGTRTIETFQRNGARSGFMYAGRKPRINTYGNSFTECNQVSDGETWQEYLAGHFCEPIGNYGVGGHGVYQAYRRMLRQERTEHGAEYVILYIWGDDPARSLMRARWVATHNWYTRQSHSNPWKRLFHGNPWAHVEMDLTRGQFVEKSNPLMTPESLYSMSDPEWMLDNLRDDLATQLHVYANLGAGVGSSPILDIDRTNISRLAETLDFRFDWSSGANRKAEAMKLLNIYGQRATNYTLDKAMSFAQSTNKRLVVVLNYTARSDYFGNTVAQYNGVRNDREILQHLVAKGFDYFDMNEVHQREYETTTGSFSQYMSRYHVGGTGHYNPRGNHFFAYSIKDKLLDLLCPRPLPYQDLEKGAIDFKGYLPGV